MASLLRRVGAEFTANGTTAGYQWFQQIASLSGGGFVMAWIDDSWDGSLYGITAQRFDADGAKVGGEIHVNNAVFLNQLDPSVAGLASGGFVVTWTGEGNGTSSDIRGRMFDPAGLPLGPEFTVNTADTIDQQGSQAIALSGGGFVVHWVDTGAPFGGNDPNVRAQLFDSAGTKVGAEFTVNATLAGTQRETGGVALEGGGFVIVWADYSNGGPGDVKGQVFDSAGNRVGGEFMASTITAGTQWSPDVAALPGGGFVVSWQGEMVAGAQIFDSVGAKIGSEIAGSDSGTGNSVSSVNVTAVPGGAFLLAWQSTPSSFLPTVRGQLFDLAGNRIGAQFQVNEAAVGGGYMDLATLASGRIVASWNIGNYDVQGAVFRAPLIGTPAADVLVGTGDSDGIAGLASNDQLSGLGGDDVLDGGLGADLMTGGTGNDVYVVDDSGDGTIELAGEGIDGVETGLADYTLQAHVENLTGNSVAGGSQTLRGNALDNFLTGGAGSDTFHLGTAGNDVVNAGAGDDLLVVDWQDSVFDVVTGPAVIVSGTGASGGYRDGTARSVAFTGLERVNVATGSGDDVIELTRGGSSAQTGAGSDKVTLGSMIDTANGGSGIDGIAADYRDAEIGIVWDLSAGPFNGIEGFEYFLGLRTGDYNDVITTTAAARSDLIDGGRGADEINVYNGHDTVSGGTLLDFSWDTLRVDWRAYDDAVQMTLVGSLYGGSDGQILGGPDRSVVLTSFELFAILTGGGNDSLVGGSRGDILNSGGGNDILDGGAGVDMMSGGTGDDVYYASSSSDVVIEFAGAGTDEIRTGVATYSLTDLANVENLTATSNVAHDFRGNSGDNAITGGAGSDVLRLYDGGDDTVLGGAGSDNFFFIGALTAADIVNGGSEIDALVLQGPYGGLTLTANVTQIENISILGGNNTNFGEPGTNLYDYVLTTNNANFAAGVQARINGAALLAGEDFTFNGSAETDASFVVY
ncbi:MAG TPA: calcium-binding protein, partial [Allosphingosinicella sp.]|nr:calcium-binding protein [Allosphingosinicella sp.]